MQPKLKALAIAVAISALSVPAFADESASFCALTQAQADVQKQLLSSMNLFATTGNASTGNSSAIAVGVSKSFSRQTQAQLTGVLADATCASYSADRKLSEQAQAVEQRGNLKAFSAMEPLLRQVLAMAAENVAKEEALLKVKASTISDVKTAYDARDTVRGLLTAVMQQRSRIQDLLPEVDESLQGLVSQSIAARAEVAGATSKLAVASAWDVSIAVGAQTDPHASSETKPFVGVTITYSFGTTAAKHAAGRVAALAEKYASEQRDGPLVQYQMALKTAQGLSDAEEAVLSGLVERRALADSTIERLQGIQSVEGQRVVRQSRLEQMAVQAQIEGSQARLDYLRSWLSKNAQATN